MPFPIESVIAGNPFVYKKGPVSDVDSSACFLECYITHHTQALLLFDHASRLGLRSPVGLSPLSTFTLPGLWLGNQSVSLFIRRLTRNIHVDRDAIRVYETHSHNEFMFGKGLSGIILLQVSQDSRATPEIEPYSGIRSTS